MPAEDASRRGGEQRRLQQQLEQSPPVLRGVLLGDPPHRALRPRATPAGSAVRSSRRGDRVLSARRAPPQSVTATRPERQKGTATVWHRWRRAPERSGSVAACPAEWPAASYENWTATCDTLHAHTQVLGKIAVELAPPEPQFQHSALRLTARGWETALLPAPDGSGGLVVALDLRTPRGRRRAHRRRRRPRAADPRPTGGRGDARAAGSGQRPRAARSRSTRRRRRCRGPCRSTRTTSTRAMTPTRSASYFAAATRGGARARRVPRRRTAAARPPSTRGGGRSTWPSTCSRAGPPSRRRTTTSSATRWTPRRSRSAGGRATRATARPRSTAYAHPAPRRFR